MKIKVPKEIKVGLHIYRIYLSNHLWHDEKRFGSVNYRTQIIEIEKSAPKTERDLTLFHEIMHIVDQNNKCRIEEDNIERLSHGLADTLITELGIDFDWSDVPDNPEAKIDWK